VSPRVRTVVGDDAHKRVRVRRCRMDGSRDSLHGLCGCADSPTYIDGRGVLMAMVQNARARSTREEVTDVAMELVEGVAAGEARDVAGAICTQSQDLRRGGESTSWRSPNRGRSSPPSRQLAASPCWWRGRGSPRASRCLGQPGRVCGGRDGVRGATSRWVAGPSRRRSKCWGGLVRVEKSCNTKLGTSNESWCSRGFVEVRPAG
jgi:hypothetical protein